MTLWRILYEYQTTESQIWMPDSVDHLGTDDGGVAVNFVQEHVVGKELPGVSGSVAAFRLRGLSMLGVVRLLDPASLREAGVSIVEPTQFES